MTEFEKQLKIKEFEKWSGKNCKNGNCPARSGHIISCTACGNLQERAWKAALERVLTLNSVRVCDDVYEDIKRELDAGTN